ncbi:hypothetical protein OKJ48_02650 [Streptomyces kunmingensis]|uniref:MYXO-CTERM domain-containing protein n=1 Tax=Streptomyces kunmingensis TaxID=68225 RepID=A0ABU6C4W5_9ACTN|nr:hypothetical protein [Streptomyces kunmingensis]MEB3959161.1 hypothetical protein [Streptomyces kunmingensis]
MTTLRWERRRQAAAYVLLGTVAAALIAALVFVSAAPGLPSAWWPQAGGAFAASPDVSAFDAGPMLPGPGAARGQTPSAGPVRAKDVCDAVVGPAHVYCLGAPAPDAAPSRPPTLADSWPLGVLAVGITVLYVLRRRRRGL